MFALIPVYRWGSVNNPYKIAVRPYHWMLTMSRPTRGELNCKVVSLICIGSQVSFFRYQETGQHDKAVRDYEYLCQKDHSSENRANLREAKRLQKLAKRKDYYRILGVEKTASGDEIKKAYRKGALLHHPDRHVDADDSVKEKEESLFKDVSEAYSILSDSRKRARYDTGQDMEDMEVGKLHGDNNGSITIVLCFQTLMPVICFLLCLGLVEDIQELTMGGTFNSLVDMRFSNNYYETTIL